MVLTIFDKVIIMIKNGINNTNNKCNIENIMNIPIRTRILIKCVTLQVNFMQNQQKMLWSIFTE